MPTSLREKIGVKSGMRCILLHAPQEMAMRVALSADESVNRLTGNFDYIHFFTTRQGKLREALQRLKPHLQPKGMLWISWPKARQLSTDLTLPEVIRIAYDAGLVESKVVGIDPTWSAIKLTFPKEGKRYQNSYGQLPDAGRTKSAA